MVTQLHPYETFVKAGTLSFNASRVAGLNDGDCVSVFDYVRSQGDVGGTLELTWL